MLRNKAGKVFLVGAGPGDPSLITRRGWDLVQSADVVVVDDLVNPLLLQKTQAAIVYVGKRGSGAPHGAFLKLPQAGINRLLISLAKEGKRVVRLKGGDPLIFGRGGEEMEALRAARIAFEIVPGVSSTIAAPAFAGIPLSDRRWSSAITFLTGQESLDPRVKTPGVDWKKLSPSGTLVILMGVGRWHQIRSTLLALGWPAKKTVAAIQSAADRNQKTILTTLDDSGRIFKKRKLVSPAIIIVGEVGSLSRRLSWVPQEKPLLGRRVVVTRAEAQSRELIQSLEEKGAFVISCPAISIQPASDDPATAALVRRLKSGASSYDWFIFTSENGVRSFQALVGATKKWWGTSRVMAVGPHTAKVLTEIGWPVHRVPAVYSSKGVLKSLGPVMKKRIFIPRVQHGPRDMVDALRKKGALVDEAAVYKTWPAMPPSPRLKNLIVQGVDAVTFTSGSTVDHFLGFFSPGQIKKIFSHAKAVSIGPTTTATLRRHGIRRIVQAREATAESLVEALQ